MKKINYSLPTVALSLLLSGCGYDIEITSHTDAPDFSDYTATVIDSKSVKGTYLDPEFRREKAMKFRHIMNEVSSVEFTQSTDALAQLDKYITELNEIDDIDVDSLRMRLLAYKGDITKFQEVDKKRTDLTVDRILVDAKPIFAEIDALTSKKDAFDAYLKPDVDKIIALNKQNEELLATIEKVKETTNKSIAKYIIDNELPVSVDGYKPHIHFSNEEEYREGDTCSPNRKDKPTFRGHQITASTGEKICVHKFHYSLANMGSLSKGNGQKIHDLAKQGLDANRDNYVKLGLVENQRYRTEKSLKDKKIIGANKHGKRFNELEYELRSLNRRLEKFGDNMFNQDRTVNLESAPFKRAKKYNKDVPQMKINRDMRVFSKFDNDYDDVYLRAAMRDIASIGYQVRMGSDGFDLPSEIEQQDILFMLASTEEQPKESDRVYLWDKRAFGLQGKLELDSRIRFAPNNKQEAQEKIFSLSRS
ncbi:hypothetical protein [Vibrio sp. 10N.261.55.A7]|uniref:hypothetical protein n=1 Tax=Vibrio sp. 10N.261.55.A7 TaxID=1880851 RepID=UPI000C85C106|nr:hypothetical protein [Vibrio sp. 10N.261.55.A7]PMJ91692.1 hypothetical protein BCU12_08920 [Vibrio sp. 10N.261.55.A7]